MSFTDPTQSDWWMQICRNRSQVQKQNISQDSSSMRSRMQKCLFVRATEGIWKKIMFKDNIFILVTSLKRIGNGKSSFYADSASHPSTARNRNKSQKVPPKPFGNYFHNIKAEAVGIAHIHTTNQNNWQIVCGENDLTLNFSLLRFVSKGARNSISNRNNSNDSGMLSKNPAERHQLKSWLDFQPRQESSFTLFLLAELFT